METATEELEQNIYRTKTTCESPVQIVCEVMRDFAAEEGRMLQAWPLPLGKQPENKIKCEGLKDDVHLSNEMRDSLMHLSCNTR